MTSLLFVTGFMVVVSQATEGVTLTQAGRYAETTVQVRLAIRGELGGVDWIIRRFSPFLRAQGRYRLGDLFAGGDEEDDVVSEAWMTVLPRLADLRPRQDRYTPVLLRFLATTVRSICNNRLRKAIRRGAKKEETPRDLDEFSHHVLGAVTAMGDTERSRQIVDAIGRLDERSRHVVVMRGIEGLPNAEIAAELGEKANTISHCYTRAVERLRADLGETILDELGEPDEPTS